MIQVQVFTFNAFMENTYVLYDKSKECIIIDPGCYEAHEQQELTSFIAENGLKPVQLINTHCHIDHVLGNAFVKRTYGLKLWAHEKDAPTLLMNQIVSQSYGFHQYEHTDIDSFFKEGEHITFGNTMLDIVFVPGHAPGHVAFIHKGDNICIGGDVLFQRSIGRTDLPGGNFDTLIKSIHTEIFTLGDDMVVYPGHGPSTTVGEEKRENPFCAL